MIVAGLLALLGMAASQAPAGAAAYNYNTNAQLQTINVGMITLDSASQTGPTGVDHPGWYTFYILNQRDDVRLSGWTLDNPLAPKVITSDMITRYGAGASYAVGQGITQNMAPYWEVDITRTNIDSLEQFNLLVIHTHTFIDLTRAERLLLRQYVDDGGTLYIEDCGGATIEPGFLFDVQFHNGGANGFAQIPNPTQRHPIITTPYFLSQDDLNGLGDKEVGNYYMTSQRGAPNTQPDPALFTAVVGNSSHKDVNNIPLPYIAAGDYGSGHIVMSSADVFDAINNPINSPGANNNPPPYSGTNFSAAPTQDLKLLVNIIAWATGTANTEGVNNRRGGTQLSSIDGGVTREWLYPDPAFAPSPTFGNGVATTTAAAIFGNIAYVSDGNGYLHAYDINPPESLSGVLNGDDGGAGVDIFTGLQWNQDFSAGTSYDELWDVQPAGSAARLSAPTIGEFPGFGPSVFVEGDDGTVYVYAASTTLTFEGKVTVARTGGGTVTPYSGQAPILPYGLPPVPPAPAVYDGRLVAGQPDATVMVDDLATAFATPYLFTLDPQNADLTPVIAPPAVASIPNRDSMNYGGADVVAYVTTEQNTWSVFLGGRDEQVQPQAGLVGFSLSAQQDQQRIGGAFAGIDAINPPEDPANGGPGIYYDNNGFPEPGFVNPNYTGPPQGFIVNPTPVGTVAPPFYGDFDNTLPAGNTSVSRTQITAKVSTTPNGASITDLLPAGGAAVGPDNNLYIAVNEPSSDSAYIEAVNEQNFALGNPGNVIKWRFALVNTGPDASGITYTFAGYQFVGPPVVDGNTVYALANNTAGTPIVLALNADAVCELQTASDLTVPPSLTQVDENGASSGTDNPINGFEFHYDKSTGIITLLNFSANAPAATYQVTANMVAPLPVQVMSNSAQPSSTALTPMNTAGNGGPLLRWWTQPLTKAVVSVGPLRKIGNSVYFTANFGNNQPSELVGVNTATGLGTDANRFINPASPTSLQRNFTSTSVIATGPSIAPISASGNFAVLQGTAGIEGFGYHPTLIADGNRLVSLGPTGNAIWSVDSTNQLQVQGGNLTDPEIGTGPTSDQSGTVVASKVSLSHPSSISQIGQDDYLVADSGNNRVVRLDTAGHVIWELTNFNDPNNLLTPAPTTTSPQSNPLLSLNQPASATMWQTATPIGASPQIVIYHYLIADAGNYRVVEIDDRYTNGSIANPQLDYHYLAWVSHTFDQTTRQYRYVSAQVVPGPNNTGYVLAAVSNVQVAPLVANGANVVLSPANQDSPGSSLLLLNYAGAAAPPAPGLPSGNGLPSAVISEVATGTPGNYVLTPMRGLRSCQVVVSPNAGAPGGYLYQAVIADDDGGFGGPIGQVTNPLAAPLTPVSALPQTGLLALDTTVTGGWSFQQAQYNIVVTEYDTLLNQQLGGGANVSNYVGTPFVPASVEKLPSGDYLIVNRGSVGSAQNINTTVNNGGAGYDANFGGNVFEVDPFDPVTKVNNELVGSILGRPANTGALSQPAFAIRPL